MEHILDILKERGFIAQITYEDELYERGFALVEEAEPTEKVAESTEQGLDSDDGEVKLESIVIDLTPPEHIPNIIAFPFS